MTSQSPWHRTCDKEHLKGNDYLGLHWWLLVYVGLTEHTGIEWGSLAEIRIGSQNNNNRSQIMPGAKCAIIATKGQG